jgi:hypothetical protein
MSIESVTSYKNTSVNWMRTQAQLTQLLEQQEVKDIRFTNISWETAERGGVLMEKNTYAIMIEFFRLTKLETGLTGKVPVRIIIPNVPTDDDKLRNQMYRLLFWYIKSKFEAVATGLVDFEQEFLPHLMIKDKSGFVGTVWQMMKKPYENLISSGETDLLKALPEPKEREEK